MKLPIVGRVAPLVVTIALVALASAGAHGQQRTIDQFFVGFTAEWMRCNPNAAVDALFHR